MQRKSDYKHTQALFSRMVDASPMAQNFIHKAANNGRPVATTRKQPQQQQQQSDPFPKRASTGVYKVSKMLPPSGPHSVSYMEMFGAQSKKANKSASDSSFGNQSISPQGNSSGHELSLQSPRKTSTTNIPRLKGHTSFSEMFGKKAKVNRANVAPLSNQLGKGDVVEDPNTVANVPRQKPLHQQKTDMEPSSPKFQTRAANRVSDHLPPQSDTNEGELRMVTGGGRNVKRRGFRRIDTQINEAEPSVESESELVSSTNMQNTECSTIQNSSVKITGQAKGSAQYQTQVKRLKRNTRRSAESQTESEPDDKEKEQVSPKKTRGYKTRTMAKSESDESQLESDQDDVPSTSNHVYKKKTGVRDSLNKQAGQAVQKMKKVLHIQKKYLSMKEEDALAEGKIAESDLIKPSPMKTRSRHAKTQPKIVEETHSDTSESEQEEATPEPSRAKKNNQGQLTLRGRNTAVVAKSFTHVSSTIQDGGEGDSEDDSQLDVENVVADTYNIDSADVLDQNEAKDQTSDEEDSVKSPIAERKKVPVMATYSDVVLLTEESSEEELETNGEMTVQSLSDKRVVQLKSDAKPKSRFVHSPPETPKTVRGHTPRERKALDDLPMNKLNHNSTIKAESGSIKRKVSRKRKTKTEFMKGTENDPMSIKDLPRTRSGRSVKPPLAWWANQRVFIHPGSDLVEIKPPTPSEQNDTLSLSASMIHFKEDKEVERGKQYLQRKRAREKRLHQNKRSFYKSLRRGDTSQDTSQDSQDDDCMETDNPVLTPVSRAPQKYASDSLASASEEDVLEKFDSPGLPEHLINPQPAGAKSRVNRFTARTLDIDLENDDLSQSFGKTPMTELRKRRTQEEERRAGKKRQLGKIVESVGNHSETESSEVYSKSNRTGHKLKYTEENNVCLQKQPNKTRNKGTKSTQSLPQRQSRSRIKKLIDTESERESPACDSLERASEDEYKGSCTVSTRQQQQPTSKTTMNKRTLLKAKRSAMNSKKQVARKSTKVVEEVKEHSEEEDNFEQDIQISPKTAIYKSLKKKSMVIESGSEIEPEPQPVWKSKSKTRSKPPANKVPKTQTPEPVEAKLKRGQTKKASSVAQPTAIDAKSQQDQNKKTNVNKKDGAKPAGNKTLGAKPNSKKVMALSHGKVQKNSIAPAETHTNTLPVEQEKIKGDVWDETDIRQYKEAVHRIKPSVDHYWHQVAEYVGTKDAKQCQDFHQYQYVDPPTNQRKCKPPPPKRPTGEKTKLTGGIGTLKRKREMINIMEEWNENHQDDLFDATPMRKVKRIKLTMPDDDDDDTFYQSRPNTQTPLTLRTPNARMAWLPGTKTPVNTMSVISPGAPLNTVDKKNMQQYVHRVTKKRPKKAAAHSIPEEEESEASQDEEIPPIQTLFAPDNREQEENQADSEVEEDYYFSDSDDGH